MKRKTISLLSGKIGFTLAEVLITLAIIGVVASLTIPAVVKNYQETQLKAQFKKAYSTIQQTFQRTHLIDFGGIAQCYYGKSSEQIRSECSSFFKKFAENLHVAKFCQKNALSGGCIPKYKSYMSAEIACVGFSENYINSHNAAWVLNNGMILITYESLTNPMPVFAVDINGFRGPNKGGYDLFSFAIGLNNNNIPVIRPSSCINIEEGGKTTEEMLKRASR